MRVLREDHGGTGQKKSGGGDQIAWAPTASGQRARRKRERGGLYVSSHVIEKAIFVKTNERFDKKQPML
jgi:hypothetical protein